MTSVGLESNTSTTEPLRSLCSSLASYKNHKENELVKNLDVKVASAVQPNDIIMQCCAQHLKIAARNPEICSRRQMYDCHKSDVKQAIWEMMPKTCLWGTQTGLLSYIQRLKLEN